MGSCNSKGCVECEAAVVGIIDKCGRTEGNLIPILHELQASMGYLSAEAMETVATELGIPIGRVHGTATFYTMFYTKPQCKNVIRLCDSPPCHIEGSKDVRGAIAKAIGVEPGETTEDGLFSLVAVQCLAACDVSPAMRVNDTLYASLTIDSVDAILERLGGG